MVDVEVGQQWTRYRGCSVKVESVLDGWVCFARWSPVRATPRVRRMKLADFEAMLKREGLALENDDG